MASLREFLRRIGRCWRLLWDPAAFARVDRWQARIQTIEGLCASEAAECLRRAVEKTAGDASFHATKDHDLKRQEALEWSRHYARDLRTAPGTAWERDFLLAWILGERKGRL
jgi:hypothetical protein